MFTSAIGLYGRTFALTFASEIGDRSQIATVVLAGHKSPVCFVFLRWCWCLAMNLFVCFQIGVTIGAILGHSVCVFHFCFFVVERC